MRTDIFIFYCLNVDSSIGANSTKTSTLHGLTESGQYSCLIYPYRLFEGNEPWEDSRSGELRVGINHGGNKGSNGIGIRITAIECHPTEVGLYEWRFDGDKVVCTVDVNNTGPKVQIAPRVVVDDIGAFWLNTRTLQANSSLVIRYEVKFSDALARLIYGPSATALSFVRTVEERGNTTCQRHVCYTPIITHYLPEDHTIGLRIYKAMNYMPTTEILAQSKDAVVTVKYDGYVGKRWTEYVIVEPTFTLATMYGVSYLTPILFANMATTGSGQIVLSGSIGGLMGIFGPYILDDDSYGGDVS